MQKKHLEIVANSRPTDCIITHDVSIGIDENKIPTKTRFIGDIIIYIKDENDPQNCKIIRINPQSIKKIHETISEIEQIIGTTEAW